MIAKDIAHKIWQIQIKAKKILSGTMVGDYSTAQKGIGFEFDQVREYQIGDDTRFIDWKSSAKVGRLLTKQYLEERNHTIVLAVDISSSSFATDKKYASIANLAAVLALVSEYSKDKVGLVLFSDKIEKCIVPAKGKAHTLRLLEAVFSVEDKNRKTDIDAAISYITKHFRQKSIVFLLSDFIDEDNRLKKGLQLISKKHDVIAARCLGRQEQGLPNVGLLPVVDPETGGTYVIDTSSKKFKDFTTSRVIKQNNFLRSCGVDIMNVRPEKDMVSEVVKFFRQRLMC